MHDKDRPDIRGLETDAYEQHGYFTSTQARAHRVSSQLLNHHVRRGRYQPVRRGLYRVCGFPRSEHDEMREKWLAVGAEKAMLSHQSALALLELSDAIPDAVHLLVPRRQRGLRRPAGVVLHTRPDDANVPTVWREGLPLTAPARTLVDTVGELQPEQAALAVRQALRRGLLTDYQLTEEAARRGKARAVEAALAAAGRVRGSRPQPRPGKPSTTG
jgi:predicted transcriptional regulator of viral defense system